MYISIVYNVYIYIYIYIYSMMNISIIVKVTMIFFNGTTMSRDTQRHIERDIGLCL